MELACRLSFPKSPITLIHFLSFKKRPNFPLMPSPTQVHCPTVQNTPTRSHKGAIQNIIHAQHYSAYSDYVTNPAESGGFQAFAFNKVKEGPRRTVS